MKTKKLKESGYKTNICFDCKKALGLCSWSEVDCETGVIRYQPPEGAVYEEIPYKLWRETTTTMYITRCPLFEPDRGISAEKLYKMTRRVERGEIIAAFDSGLTVGDISKKLGFSRETILFWKKRLIKEGSLRG